ncbi:voltage-gated potassium channel [Candidatus Planktophila limnetica]|jgi:voltage-gated potassium channel|uniref:Voltage-gated potassium channel n=1 Tax=Candidatus Planktophila limnetica TaxID=573600 RepID=A0A249LGN6_9ACTN|nr:potassium channel family protein [Candidatus Planktophila limnetica]ASY28167.1 voltage-gated potassium channel [Candidatus Planktophila limnetica]
MKKRFWNETLTVLAVAFLVSFSYPAFTSEINAQTQTILDAIQWISWTAFAADLIYGIIRAESKKRYLKSHPLEIAAVVLPFLRPLRLLRIVSFGSLVIQKVVIGRSFGITIRVFVTTFFLTYIAAIQITLIERNALDSNIKTFGDGFWWAITTVTTVGYGDRFPTTTEGRVLAVGLMMLGIALIGVISATIAATFVKMMQDDSKNV